MNEFREAFEVGSRCINRVGWYTVTGFDGPAMCVRYDDGQTGRLTNFNMLMRILENMLAEGQDEAERLQWEMGRTADEMDTDALVEAAEALILAPLEKLIRQDSNFEVLREAAQVGGGDCTVYVVLLSKLSQQMYRGHHTVGLKSMPCVYVGQSAHDPEERLQMHKVGHHSSYFVRRFGMALLPGVYESYYQLTRPMALAAEAALAEALGKLGCTVFGGH